ncbi:response regulator transcription factor [Methylophaga sulfidovorans]|uniref:Two component transcriptional regulator, LuxR family n=1 Tax=Methylophaga sulfidovorans TaxID=45496 RepID=A0A1I3UAU5_9GAMM|nr:response regulator [Methylophaga sulfidovorans]SFJ80025.1 two component transcriptional regulator, LuxR family [Methylophaga sulfidovorans]
MKQVYIVDDDDAVRGSLSMLLRSEDFDVIAYGDPIIFMSEVEETECGCIVLDLCMPNMSGMEVMEEMHKRDIKIPVICITGHGDIPTAVKALKSGAYDFLEKPFDSTKLIGIIKDCIADRMDKRRQELFESNAKEAVNSLTPREHQVLRGMVDGYRNKQIAFDMDISIRTVELHRVHVMEKLGANSLSDVLKIAIASGFDYVDLSIMKDT